MRKRVHPETNILNYSIPYRPGIICRLAEAYLNYAEALNEWAPEQTDKILKYVNLVRERAGIPQYGTGKDSNGLDKIPAPADQTAMREAIRRERRVEFNCEYAIRFDDIRRWKQIDILRGDFYGMNKFGTEKAATRTTRMPTSNVASKSHALSAKRTIGSPFIKINWTRTPTSDNYPNGKFNFEI